MAFDDTMMQALRDVRADLPELLATLNMDADARAGGLGARPGRQAAAQAGAGLSLGGGRLRGRLGRQIHLVQHPHRPGGVAHRRPGRAQSPGAGRPPRSPGAPCGPIRRPGPDLRDDLATLGGQRPTHHPRRSALLHLQRRSRPGGIARHPRHRHRRPGRLCQPRAGAPEPGERRRLHLHFHQRHLQQPRQHRFHRPAAHRHGHAALLPGLPGLSQLHRRRSARTCPDRGGQPLRPGA